MKSIRADLCAVLEASGNSEHFTWITIKEITFVIGYFASNDGISRYRKKLNVIKDAIQEISGPCILPSNFKARARESMDATHRYVRKVNIRDGN